MVRLGVAAGLLSAALGACSGSAGGDAGAERVVVLVIDATHAAHVGSYGGPAWLTPQIDRLAARGVRFDRAFSNNTWTLASTASLMTGQYQETHGVVTNKHKVPASATLMAELFHAAGYRTAAFVQMAYASSQYGFGQGFDEFHYYGMGSAARTAQTLPEVGAWMDAHARERYLLYVHLRRPHSPYNPSPALLERLDEGCPLADRRRDAKLARADALDPATLSEDDLAHVRHLYRANLSTVDGLLGDLFARAERDAALVVLTSDHGEALGEHGVLGHGTHLYAECIDVPLVFAGPGVTAGVDSQPASTVDVLPTLLELCDLAVPPGVALDGRSLAARLAGRGADTADEVRFASGRYTLSNQPRLAVVRGDHKLVLDEEGAVTVYARSAGAEAEAPPGAAASDETRRLEALLREWAASHADVAARSGDRVESDPELERDLEALGYGG